MAGRCMLRVENYRSFRDPYRFFWVFFFSVQDFFKKLFVKYIDLPHIIAYMQLMEFALAANSGFGTECFIIQKV